MKKLPGTLLDGYKRFRSGRYKQDADKYAALSQGQSPKSMIIACADSRVDPTTIFDAGPGDLFVVRNVANLVPPFTSKDTVSVGSALEYAVKNLRVKDIIVLGHAHCGGVAALCQKIINDKNAGVKESSTDFIESWVDIAKPGLSKVNFSNEKENLEVVSERAVLLYSYSNLLTYPWIRDAVNKKSLDIHAWWLDFKTVKLWKKSQGNDTFIPIEF